MADKKKFVAKPFVFTDAEVEAKYKSNNFSGKTKVHVPGEYSGTLADIPLKAADESVARKSNWLILKDNTAKTVPPKGGAAAAATS